MAIAHVRDGTPVGAWLLKANRDVWDLPGVLAAGGSVDDWRLVPGYRVDLMEPGHPVLLWLTGADRDRPPPGVCAVGVVAGPVEERDGDPSDPAWRDPSAAREVRPFVPVRLDVVDPPLTRAELRGDGRLSDMEVFRAPRMGSPVVVTPEELAVLEEHLGRRLS